MSYVGVVVTIVALETQLLGSLAFLVWRHGWKTALRELRVRSGEWNVKGTIRLRDEEHGENKGGM